MNISKLAKGGIINTLKENNNFLDYDREYVVPLNFDLMKKCKYIYLKTKNRRIKKKQVKRCSLLKLQLELSKHIKVTKRKGIKINVNGRCING